MGNSAISMAPAYSKTPKFSLKTVGKWLLTLFLLGYAFIQVYPLIWLLLFSFKDNNEIFGGNVIGLPHTWRWSNYSAALTTGDVGIYFMNSLLVTLITIVISSIMIAATSYAIVRMYWKMNNLFLTYFLIGLMVPIHATLLPMFVILRNMHMLNTYWALIIPYVAFALPMGIFIMTGFLNGIPRELEEAACIDGCSVYKIFYKMIVPLLKPALATVAIFTYMNTWNELMFANTFINSDKLKTLTVGIMSLAGQHSTDWGPIGAGLVIATVPTLLIYILLSDQVQKSLIVGSVKG